MHSTNGTSQLQGNSNTPPPELWEAAARCLVLPVTRQVLARFCELREVREHDREMVALVAVEAPWLRVIRTRQQLVAEALAEAIGGPVELQLQAFTTEVQ